MPLPEDLLQRYITETARIDVSDASATRAVKSSAFVTNALQALASQSLFDTEPEHLHSVLEALAEDDSVENKT